MSQNIQRELELLGIDTKNIKLKVMENIIKNKDDLTFLYLALDTSLKPCLQNPKKGGSRRGVFLPSYKSFKKTQRPKYGPTPREPKYSLIQKREGTRLAKEYEKLSKPELDTESLRIIKNMANSEEQKIKALVELLKKFKENLIEADLKILSITRSEFNKLSFHDQQEFIKAFNNISTQIFLLDQKISTVFNNSKIVYKKNYPEVQKIANSIESKLDKTLFKNAFGNFETNLKDLFAWSDTLFGTKLPFGAQIPYDWSSEVLYVDTLKNIQDKMLDELDNYELKIDPEDEAANEVIREGEKKQSHPYRFIRPELVRPKNGHAPLGIGFFDYKKQAFLDDVVYPSEALMESKKNRRCPLSEYQNLPLKTKIAPLGITYVKPIIVEPIPHPPINDQPPPTLPPNFPPTIKAPPSQPPQPGQNSLNLYFKSSACGVGSLALLLIFLIYRLKNKQNLRRKKIAQQRREFNSLIRQERERVNREAEASRKIQAAIIIQAATRDMLARRTAKRRNAATKIQAATRGMLARKSLKKEKSAATRIQAATRGMLARKSLKKRKNAAKKNQDAINLREIQARFNAMNRPDLFAPTPTESTMSSYKSTSQENSNNAPNANNNFEYSYSPRRIKSAPSRILKSKSIKSKDEEKQKAAPAPKKKSTAKEENEYEEYSENNSDYVEQLRAELIGFFNKQISDLEKEIEDLEYELLEYTNRKLSIDTEIQKENEKENPDINKINKLTREIKDIEKNINSFSDLHNTTLTNVKQYDDLLKHVKNLKDNQELLQLYQKYIKAKTVMKRKVIRKKMSIKAKSPQPKLNKPISPKSSKSPKSPKSSKSSKSPRRIISAPSKIKSLDKNELVSKVIDLITEHEEWEFNIPLKIKNSISSEISDNETEGLYLLLNKENTKNKKAIKVYNKIRNKLKKLGIIINSPMSSPKRIKSAPQRKMPLPTPKSNSLSKSSNIQVQPQVSNKSEILKSQFTALLNNRIAEETKKIEKYRAIMENTKKEQKVLQNQMKALQKDLQKKSIEQQNGEIAKLKSDIDSIQRKTQALRSKHAVEVAANKWLTKTFKSKSIKDLRQLYKNTKNKRSKIRSKLGSNLNEVETTMLRVFKKKLKMLENQIQNEGGKINNIKNRNNTAEEKAWILKQKTKKKNSAAKIIQAATRGMLARKTFKNLKTRNSAARKIQAATRNMLRRKQMTRMLNTELEKLEQHRRNINSTLKEFSKKSKKTKSKTEAKPAPAPTVKQTKTSRARQDKHSKK